MLLRKGLRIDYAEWCRPPPLSILLICLCNFQLARLKVHVSRISHTPHIMMDISCMKTSDKSSY